MWGDWSLRWRSFQAPFTQRWRYSKTALFPLFGLPSPLFHWKKRIFMKTLLKTDEFENGAFLLSSGRKIVWKRNFSKAMLSRLSFDFPVQHFLKRQFKLNCHLCVFPLAWYERKHLICFQSRETSSCSKRKPPTKKVTSAIGSIPCYWVYKFSNFTIMFGPILSLLMAEGCSH